MSSAAQDLQAAKSEDADGQPPKPSTVRGPNTAGKAPYLINQLTHGHSGCMGHIASAPQQCIPYNPRDCVLTKMYSIAIKINSYKQGIARVHVFNVGMM